MNTPTHTYTAVIWLYLALHSSLNVTGESAVTVDRYTSYPRAPADLDGESVTAGVT